ncbi:acyl-CoA dehydrogenase [Paraburkholderia hospita]|uniref:acyl-CoA dehydrogenase n=1 Tax=Paraburkholderia hospita TaxID=169430 RepID=UPI000B34633F|nr:acyl-CoA dehydrogenase [Paraburkholderia hospita]OUL92783.1 acyl-CoA dehydrogenase [Paraburkholderia hospita]
MTTYVAPTRDMLFAMNELAGLAEIAALPGNEEVTTDVVEAILDEAARFATEVLAPINAQGDRQGCTCKNGHVTTADGFKAAYSKFVESGWNAMPGSPDFGGQGLPSLVSTAVLEMWKASNMAFSLCQMLTLGAVAAIAHHGSERDKQRYLPKMVSGEWTGTMNLTESQAGSDLSAVRTKAAPEGDHYRISGTKIFITWGEHDMAENIIHMVLARLPDAPEGTKGISLFVVPKFLVNADGSLGERNDLICASIEHKMGIHGSPTAVMAFGENEGAIGYLVGEANRGLGCMFTMMNHARLNVGLEGVAISERAYQQALGYARERIQSRPIGATSLDPVAIIQHPDVRRMLMDMKARIEAMRALAYFVAAQIDKAQSHPDAAERQKCQAMTDLLTPVVKGWCTENAVDITSAGIQVHGGVGFIEETGACQHMRDARITTIYEGTTGIQANDLIGRKVARDQGAAVKLLLGEMNRTLATLEAADDRELRVIAGSLQGGTVALENATGWLLSTYDRDPASAAAGAVPYLKLLGTVTGGWLMARAALVAAEKHAPPGSDFYRAKKVTARFYAEHVLPEVHAFRAAIVDGAGSVLALDESLF